MINKKCLIIYNDVFDISNRIKKINKKYILCFNTVNKKYEIHNKDRQSNSFEFSIPYNKIDIRTLKMIYKKLKDNTENIFKEIDLHNKKLAKNLQDNLLDKANHQIKNVYDYSARLGRDLSLRELDEVV